MMNTKNTYILTIIVLILSLALSACDVRIDRNDDGSLTIESYMTEEALQAQIDQAIADPLIKDFSVAFNSGYASVSAVRKRVFSDTTDDLSFRLILGAEDGHLTAEISDAQVNNFSFDPDIVAVWNQRLATKLEKDGRRNPNSRLEQVVMDPQGVSMIWRVETAPSRSTNN